MLGYISTTAICTWLNLDPVREAVEASRTRDA
jgi:hypothetical protein